MAPAQREAVMPRRLSLSELPNKKDLKTPSPQQQEAPAMPAPAQKQQNVKIPMAVPPKPLQPKRQHGLEAPRGVEEAAKKQQPLPQKQEPSSMPAPAQKQQKVKITMALPPKKQQKQKQGLEAPQGTKQQQQQRDAKTAANSTGPAPIAPPGTDSVSKECSSKAPKAPPAASARNVPAPATATARAEGPAAEVSAKKKPSPPSALPVTKARKEAATDSSTAAAKKSSSASRPEGSKRIITVGGRGASSSSVSACATGTATAGTIAKKPLSSGAPVRKIITFSGAAPVPEKPAARPQPSLIRSSIPPLFVTPSAAPQPRQQQQQQPSSGSVPRGPSLLSSAPASTAAAAAPQRASKGPAASEMPPPPPVRPSGKARVALQVQTLASSGSCSFGEGEKERKTVSLDRAGKDGGLLSKAPLPEAPSATSALPPRPADALRDITNSSPGEKQGMAW